MTEAHDPSRPDATGALPPDGLEPVTLALLGLRPLPPAPRWPGLSPTESRVAARLALGATYREIAAELGSSPKTIETHRRNLLTKLGLRSTVALVRYAIRRGLVEADESAYERGRLIQSEAATRREEEHVNRTNYTATAAADAARLAWAKRFRTWMDAEGLTITGIRTLYGVSAPTVTAWRGGTKMPSAQHLHALERAGFASDERAQ